MVRLTSEMARSAQVIPKKVSTKPVAFDPQPIARGFWHGPPLGPYQLLCLRSFASRGICVEVFSYDSEFAVPEWVISRDAREIFPTERVLEYQVGFGRGSPSLHANLFRYIMLHQLGGWWIDLDVILMRPTLPESEFFFARFGDSTTRLNTAVLKFPSKHPLMAEAIARSETIGEHASEWAQTGPLLFTELVERHELANLSQPYDSVHPIPWFEVDALFNPDRCNEMRERCAASTFLHLFNEVWRGSGIPRELGPPVGSFIDQLFAEHDIGIGFKDRMTTDNVVRWIENRNRRIRLEGNERRLLVERSAMEARLEHLEKEQANLLASRAAMETRLEGLLASTSWKVTAPLRALKRVLPGSRRSSSLPGID